MDEESQAALENEAERFKNYNDYLYTKLKEDIARSTLRVACQALYSMGEDKSRVEEMNAIVRKKLEI